MQPTGSDRSTALAGYAPAFASGVMLENPGANQAGVTAPRTSAFGQALRRIVAGGRVVRLDAPVLPQTTGGYRGFVGRFRSRAATGVIVPKGASYTGQLPMSQQPKVDKPRPWTDMFGIGAKYSG